MNITDEVAPIGDGSLTAWLSLQKAFGRLGLAAVAVVIGCLIAYGGWFVLGGVFVAVFIFWPVQTALGVYALLVPFDSVSALGSGNQGTTLTFWVGGASVLALLVTGLAQGRITVPPRAAWWWAALVLWGSVTVLWAIDPAVCAQRLPTAFSLLLMYLVAISLRVTKTELLWATVAAIVGGVIAGSYAASSYYGGAFFENEMRSSLIIAGRETDPNYFAASLLLPISLAIGMFTSVRGWIARTLSLLAVATMGFAVLLSMSRGALVAVIVIVLLFCYRLRVNWRILVVPAVLGVFLAWVPKLFFLRLEGAGASKGAGRLDIWVVGLALLQRYGLLGAGLDNFPIGYQQLAGLASRFPYHGYIRGAHNTFLNMAVENGIVGFGLFVAGLISQFRAAQRSRARLVPPLVSYEAACWGLLVAGFFLDLFWWKLFWLAWMLLALASRVYEPPLPRDTVTAQDCG